MPPKKRRRGLSALLAENEAKYASRAANGGVESIAAFAKDAPKGRDERVASMASRHSTPGSGGPRGRRGRAFSEGHQTNLMHGKRVRSTSPVAPSVGVVGFGSPLSARESTAIAAAADSVDPRTGKRRRTSLVAKSFGVGERTVDRKKAQAKAAAKQGSSGSEQAGALEVAFARKQAVTGPARLIPAGSEAERFLVQCLEDDPYATNHDLCQLLEDDFGIKCSKDSVSRTLTTRMLEQGFKNFTSKAGHKVTLDPTAIARNERLADLHWGFYEGVKDLSSKMCVYQDQCPIKRGSSAALKGRSRAGTPIVGTGEYTAKKWTLQLCIAYERIVKATVGPSVKGGDVAKFLLDEQEPKWWAPLLDGGSTAEWCGKNGIKFFFQDMLGRAGRAYRPTKLHFHPRIRPGFAAHGVSENKITPLGHAFSPVEEMNARIQHFSARWIPENIVIVASSGAPEEWIGKMMWDFLGWVELTGVGRQKTRGPQTLVQAEACVNDFIKQARARAPQDKGSESRYCRSAYHSRHGGAYFLSHWAKHLNAWILVGKRRRRKGANPRSFQPKEVTRQEMRAAKANPIDGEEVAGQRCYSIGNEPEDYEEKLLKRKAAAARKAAREAKKELDRHQAKQKKKSKNKSKSKKAPAEERLDSDEDQLDSDEDEVAAAAAGVMELDDDEPLSNLFRKMKKSKKTKKKKKSSDSDNSISSSGSDSDSSISSLSSLNLSSDSSDSE